MPLEKLLHQMHSHSLQVTTRLLSCEFGKRTLQFADFNQFKRFY